MDHAHRPLLDALDAARQAAGIADFAEAGLEALRIVLPADYYSVISYRPQHCDPGLRVYEAGRGWLGDDAEPIRRFGEVFAYNPAEEHPTVRAFFAGGMACNALVRSQVIADREWHRTVFYQGVDRHFRIGDMATVALVPEPGRLVTLNAARPRAFSPSIQPRLRQIGGLLTALASARAAAGATDVAETVAAALTPRELEVLQRIASGDTNDQIATRLDISEGTVRKHVEHILRKLGVRNRTAAVHALRHGSRA